MLNTDIQDRELSQPQIVEPETSDGNRLPSVKQVNGRFKKFEDEILITGGPHCEVWKGLWEKESGKVIGGEKVGGEGVEAGYVKVSQDLTTSILLK